MDPAATLYVVIEFSIGLAGFASIVVALGRRPGDRHTADAVRITSLLINSAAASGLSFVTIGLLHAAQTPDRAWLVASVLGGVLQVALVTWGFFQRTRLDAAKAFAVIPKWFGFIFIGGATVNVPFQFANAAGWFGPPAFLPVYVGLVFWLALAFLQFVHVLIARPEGEAG